MTRSGQFYHLVARLSQEEKDRPHVICDWRMFLSFIFLICSTQEDSPSLFKDDTTFLNGRPLCGVRENDRSVMFPLIPTTFLNGKALLYVKDTVSYEANSPDVTIYILGSHVLHDRARRVNAEIWMEFKFGSVKGARSTRRQDICNGAILNDRITRNSNVLDSCTGPKDSAEPMAKPSLQ